MSKAFEEIFITLYCFIIDAAEFLRQAMKGPS